MPQDAEERDFQERVAENESRFRTVNEDVDRGRPSTDTHSRVPFVCECGHEECRRLIDLTPAEYHGVRSDPRQFAVADGHELPVAEVVVSRHPGWNVVRKTGIGADVAQREA
jgi:hypothetical protein